MARRRRFAPAPAPAPDPTGPALLPTELEPVVTAEHYEHRPGLLRTVVDEVHVSEGSVEQLLADACRFRHRHRAGDSNWAGASFDVAVSLAYTGWEQGTALVDGMFARVTAEHTQSLIPVLDYSDEPDGDVDVERWIAGDDECYLVERTTARSVSVAGRFVNLVLNPFASWAVGVEDVLRRGMYFAALAYMLERSGYRTRITMRMPTEGERKKWLLVVDVKDYQQPLDLPRVMFWLAHPAALRQHIIASYRGERQDMIYNRNDYPQDDPTTILAPGVFAETDLEAWLQDVLVKFGLKIEEGE